MHRDPDRLPSPRREDRRLLTAGGVYVADVTGPLLAGAVAVHFVRSHVAHGRIGSVDTSRALDRPGVIGVFVAADLDIGPMPPVLPRFAPELSPPLLATGWVRYVGEPVVAVVADTAARAVDAAEHVDVQVHPVDAVADVVAAAQGTPLVIPSAGTNVASEVSAGQPVDEWLDACELVVRVSLEQPRVAACPLEMRGAASVWQEGRLHHWVSTQGPHGVKRVLAVVFGLPDAAVRVVAPDVGGGFGPKFSNYAEDVVVAWLARRVGRPVRWVETRQESMTGLHHGRAQRQRVALGGTNTGELQAYRLEVLQDAGAYASLGAYAPDATIRMTTGVYTIPHAHGTARALLTNTTPVSAYRGTGRPEATCAIERAVDLFARAIGADPVALRLRNLVDRGAFPYETPVGTVYDSGDYADALRRVCDAAGYEELRAEQAARRARDDSVQLGVGVCAYVESTAAGPGMEFATITIDGTGRATVATGSSPHGQGHVSTWSVVVHDALGIPEACVHVLHGDTDVVAAGLGTFASRSVQLAGSAIVRAAEQLVTRARAVSADVFEADAGDVVFDRAAATFSVAGSPARTLGWGEVAARAPGGSLVEQAMFTGAMTFPFGAHIAVVEVDTETGAVQLRRHVAVDDAGRLVHPVIAEGQIHGGIGQAVGEALFEEFRYDAQGIPLTSSLLDYAVPSAAEMPSFEVAFTETAAPSNPLGAKGVGESGIIGGLAAIQNAVCDALAPLGVRHLDIPFTPERVWRSIRSNWRVPGRSGE
jgi:carbon-monoxide dehydrogenase large subunit